MNIHEYVNEQRFQLASFGGAWVAAHRRDPEKYPLSMEPGNEGLWDEMFQIFCETGDV